MSPISIIRRVKPERQPCARIPDDLTPFFVGLRRDIVFQLIVRFVKAKPCRTRAAQVLIDITTPEGRQSGLAHTSAVKCENIHTLPIASVIRVLGSLSPSLMQQVDDALKASLALS